VHWRASSTSGGGMKVAAPEETVLARQREERAEIARIVAGEIDRFEYFGSLPEADLPPRLHPAPRPGRGRPGHAGGLREGVPRAGRLQGRVGLRDVADADQHQCRARRRTGGGSRSCCSRSCTATAATTRRMLPASLDPADGHLSERDLLSREIRRRLADALVGLSPRQRAVFVMKHYEEKSIAEICERPDSTRGRSSPTSSRGPQAARAPGGP